MIGRSGLFVPANAAYFRCRMMPVVSRNWF